MMANRRDIFNEQGCLSQYAIEAYIRGDLIQSENNRIRKHIGNCLLCSNALQGADEIDNAEKYSEAVKDLKGRWSAKKAETAKSYQLKLTFVISVAASVLLFFSIVALVRYQKQVRYEVLAQLTEEGEYIDDVLSGSPIKSLRNSGSQLQNQQSEDSARNEFIKSGQSEESILPVAQIEETVIYPDTDEFDYDAVITAKSEVPEPKTRILRSPFRIMSHPPARRNYTLPDEKSDEDDLFIVVEDMPRFRGEDLQSFRKYVFSNIRYPREALNINVSGAVYIQFVINKKGELVDPTIIKSDDPLLNKEVIRVISQSPKWTPGKQRGRPVDVSLIMPVDFVIRR